MLYFLPFHNNASISSLLASSGGAWLTNTKKVDIPNSGTLV